MDIKEIASTLKSEFIGIDDIIDRIIHCTRHWLAGKEIRTPIIVCLWGMTGSGKTQLVNRFLELAGLKEYQQYFSMGELGSLHNLLDDDAECITANQNVLVFDEFHRCNTRNPEKMRERVERDELEHIWNLLDTGIIHTSQNFIRYHHASALFYEIQQVSLLAGISQKTVKEVEDYFDDKSTEGYEKWNNIRYLNDPDTYYPIISTLQKEGLYKNLIKHPDFYQYTIAELIEFYESLITKRFPKTIDYHNSLIFVMGNLDRLYTSALDMSPNVECENLHQKFKRYGIHDAKEVLTQIFDPEQIARLGCNHLLYVPFSMKQYREITLKYLNALNLHYDSSIEFMPSVVSYILNEGLFPTQGVRSVISAIKNIIEPLIHDFHADFDEKNLKATVKNGRLQIASESQKKTYQLLRLRCSKENVNQELLLRISVHEAGHSILYHETVGLTPRGIFIDQTGGEPHGGMQPDERVKYLTLTQIKNKVMMLLGGIAAELVVYGEHTLGGQSDLIKATEALTQAKSKFGMYSSQLLVTRTEGESSDYFKNEGHEEIEHDLQELLEKAQEILKGKRSKLIELTELIRKKGRISEKELAKILPARHSNPASILKYEDFLTRDRIGQEAEAAYSPSNEPCPT